jgi:hypothetical protein
VVKVLSKGEKRKKQLKAAYQNAVANNHFGE